jgi:hypothetical protein
VVAEDKSLDRVSRELIAKVSQLRDIEERKRGTTRSSDDFHDLARKAELTALEVWDIAREEQAMGSDESPDPEERSERRPGDWTDAEPPTPDE